MTNEFPLCPICKSEANYWVNDFGLIIQCNACVTTFRITDNNSLVLFSAPSALVDKDVSAALSTLKDRVLPISFWKTLKLDPASITQSEAATRTRLLGHPEGIIWGDGPTSRQETRDYNGIIGLTFLVAIVGFIYISSRGSYSYAALIVLGVFIVIISLFAQLRYHPPPPVGEA